MTPLPTQEPEMSPHSLLYVPTDLMQSNSTRPSPRGEARERRWALVLVGLVLAGGLLAALLPA